MKHNPCNAGNASQAQPIVPHCSTITTQYTSAGFDMHPTQKQETLLFRAQHDQHKPPGGARVSADFSSFGRGLCHALPLVVLSACSVALVTAENALLEDIYYIRQTRLMLYVGTIRFQAAREPNSSPLLPRTAAQILPL